MIILDVLRSEGNLQGAASGPLAGCTTGSERRTIGPAQQPSRVYAHRSSNCSPTWHLHLRELILDREGRRPRQHPSSRRGPNVVALHA